MVKEYEKLAKSFDGAHFHHHETKVKVKYSFGVHVTLSKFTISIPYKNHIIHIENEFGTSNLGTVKMRNEKSLMPEFEIKSQSHLKNLFLRRNKRLRVNCNDSRFKFILEQALVRSGADEVAKNNSFEPFTKVKKIEDLQFIITQYHLQLKDKIGAVIALIEFYKEIVDKPS